MKHRTFIVVSAASGTAAFLIFRWVTHPLETALIWLLFSAFLTSSLLCSAVFSLLCQRVRLRWLRLVAVPLFLTSFTVLSGMGVYGVTRLVFGSRPRSPDDGGLLYGATSGMQMLSFDHGLWLHVVFAVALPLLVLSALSAIAAFAGVYGSQSRKAAA